MTLQQLYRRINDLKYFLIKSNPWYWSVSKIDKILKKKTENFKYNDKYFLVKKKKEILEWIYFWN